MGGIIHKSNIHQIDGLNMFQIETRATVQKMINFVLTDCPETIELIDFYSSVTPLKLTNNDVLREIIWVIYNSGFRFDVIKKYWPKLLEAFSYSEVKEVAKWSNNADFYAKRVCKISGFNNLRKAKWCILNAQRIIDLDTEKCNFGGLIRYFDELSKKSTTELVRIIPKIKQDLNFIGIGNVTIFHLLKNLGIEIFKPDRHVKRVLTELGLIDIEDNDHFEIYDAITSLGALLDININELDTLLFVYGRITGDHIKEELKTINLPEDIESW